MKVTEEVLASISERSRKLARAAGYSVLFTAGMVAAEAVSGTMWWKDKSQTGFAPVRGYGPDPREAVPHKAWFFFPGTGTRSSLSWARAVGPVLDGTPMSLNLPQHHASLKQVGRDFEQCLDENEIKRVSFFCGSAGGVAVTRLPSRVLESVITDEVVFDSTPASIDNARGGGRVPRALVTARKLGYRPGIISRPLAAAVSYHGDPDRNGPITWRDRVREAKQSLGREACSSDLILEGMSWLCEDNRDNLQRFMGSLPMETRIGYLSPDPPGRDLVVDVEQSAQIIEEACGGREFTRLPLAGTRHNRPADYPDVYQTVMADWLYQAA